MMDGNERIKKLEGKKRELELQINKLNQSENRKERTRRLIQKGALLEKYFEASHLSVEETEELLKIFADLVNEKKPDIFKT